VVKKAVRRSDGAVVAVKCIQRQRLGRADLENLKREIDIMASLQHPHVIGLIDVFGDEQAEIHLVTEFVGGGELFDRIVAKSSYCEAEARAVVQQLLSTLAFLHANNVVHRDIKVCHIRDRARDVL
jgi:serine/threonine protein kinase